MCGGKGSRMNKVTNPEKPLQVLKGKTLIGRVIEALQASNQFEKIIAVPSPYTPRTSVFIRSNYAKFDHVRVVESEGNGYSLDLGAVINNIVRPSMAFILPADLPLIDAKIIRKIIANCLSHCPCTSVVIEKQFVEDLGIKPSVIICLRKLEYCHSGISIIDSSKLKSNNCKLKESYIIMNEKEIAVNVNTGTDLEVAKLLLSC
jgi:adenosylcobinamide-phosphate guanylyltransferase